MRIVIGFLMYLLRMLEVLTLRANRPHEFGGSWQTMSDLRAFRDRVGKPAKTAILCNTPLPANLPQARLQKKVAPLPARIQTTRAYQTAKNPNRLRGKPSRKRIGRANNWFHPTLR